MMFPGLVYYVDIVVSERNGVLERILSCHPDLVSVPVGCIEVNSAHSRRRHVRHGVTEGYSIAHGYVLCICREHDAFACILSGEVPYALAHLVLCSCRKTVVESFAFFSLVFLTLYYGERCVFRVVPFCLGCGAGACGNCDDYYCNFSQESLHVGWCFSYGRHQSYAIFPY